MNPFAHLNVSSVDNLEEHLKLQNYSAVIYGFKSFKEAGEINKTCRHFNVPFYVLNTSGLFGFFYIDIGQNVTYIKRSKETDADQEILIQDSKSLEDYFKVYTDES